MLPQEIIRTKRDGGEIDAEAIAAFIAGLTDGSVTEGQVAALAMAVFFNGMTRAEAVAQRPRRDLRPTRRRLF